MSDKIYLGCHINLSSPKYYLQTVEQAHSFGANTFMFYTGAPQNTFRKSTSELWIKEGREKIKELGINESKIVIHAPYIINLANVANPSTQELARSFLKQELKRVNDFGVKILVLHPGSHVNQGKEIGLNAIVDGLNDVLENNNINLTVAIMGCVVNGPGEAKNADIGVAGGKGQWVIFKKGTIIDTVPNDDIYIRLIEEINKLI